MYGRIAMGISIVPSSDLYALPRYYVTDVDGDGLARALSAWIPLA